jgi:hypothetical protein
MSVRISIPLEGNGNITIEGNLEFIKETIPRLKEIYEQLGASKAALAPPIVTIGKEIATSLDKPLPIPAKIKTSPTDAVNYLFSEGEWGIKGRTASEIKNALNAEGINRDSKYISAVLIQLVKRARLHRVKDPQKKQWVYSRY